MNRIWLNHAATSWPKPPGVLERIQASLEEPPAEPGRSARAVAGPVEGCRRLLAEILHAPDPRRFALVPGATYALNLAIHAALQTIEACAAAHPRLPIRCVSSKLEHNSVLRPLRHLEAEGRLLLDLLTRKEFEDAGAVFRHIRLGADLVVLTACSNVTGSMPDLEALTQACRKSGAVLILDAAQAAGAVPIDLAGLPARTLIALPGHKGLLGPQGIGALWVGPGFTEADLPPLVVGGTGVRSASPLHPRDWPLHFEAGTPNGPGLAGLEAALEYVRGEGIARLGAHRRAMAERLAAGLNAQPGVTTYLPGSGDLTGGVVAFNLADWEPGDAAQALAESFGIETRGGLHCAPLVHAELGAPRGTLRASVGWSTTADEIDALVAAVAQMTAAARAA